MSSRRRRAEGPKAPRDSKAAARNATREVRHEYLESLCASAAAAPDPAWTAVACRWLGAQVWMVVASQAIGKPRSNGRTVAPSGRFPSSRVRPTGSSTLTTPASANAAFILEFTSEWRACLPTPLWQVRAWSPSSWSGAPQLHLPGVATGSPNRSPMATCSAAFDSRVSSRELGSARKREADSEVAQARSRATSACPGVQAGSGAAAAEAHKDSKYSCLTSRVAFRVAAFESLGAFGPSARRLLDDIATKIKSRTGDTRARTRLYRRIAAAIQTGNYGCITEAHSRPSSPWHLPRRLIIFRI